MNWFVLGISWINNILVKMNWGNYAQNFKLVVKLNLNGSLHTGGFHSKQTNKLLVPTYNLLRFYLLAVDPIFISLFYSGSRI